MKRFLNVSLLCSWFAALVNVACSDTERKVVEEDTSEPDGGGQQSASDAGADAASDDNELSAVVTAILLRGIDADHTYLLANEGAPRGFMDLDGAPELTGGEVWQSEDAIFVGSNERLQRFIVKRDYSFELTGELSFANFGISYLGNSPLFFSPTRAYYVDTENSQVIVFNPTSMEMVGQIDVPDLQREGYFAWFGRPRRIGDRFLATVLYTNEDWTQTAPDSTVGLVIEDDASEPVHLLRDERGAGAYLSWLSADGDFYFSADGLSGQLGIMDLQDIPGPRVLRLQNNADVIDSDYLLDLGDLLDTPGVFGFWPVVDTQFVVQAWASDVDPRDVLEPGDNPWAAPYFDWWMIDAQSGEFAPVEGMERSVANNTIELRLDGTTYLERAAAATSAGQHELYALDPNGSAQKVAEANGDFWFLGRVKRHAD